MKELITSYLDDMKLAWTPSTLRSERYRLNAVVEVLDGNPSRLWDLLESKGIKPYSRVTTWTRVTRFWDWLIEKGHRNGPNNYNGFRQRNARLFKNAYVRTSPSLSFEQANIKIGKLKDNQVRSKARELLQTGMRYSESFTLQDGRVVGKGGKSRRVFSDSSVQASYNKSYSTFRRQLAECGLKPHDLRKLFLTELVNNGANEFELREIAGWSDLNTAASYIKVNENKLKDLVRRVHDK